MLSAYVCRQCRVRLTRRAAPPPTPQWQPRATYLSLRGGQVHGLQDEAHNAAHQGPQSHYAESSTISKTSRYAALVRERAVEYGHPPEAALEVAPEDEPETEPSYAASLEQALAKGTAAGAWKVFNEIYTSRDCKALTDPSPHDVALMGEGRLFISLLTRINSAFCFGTKGLPVTPTELLLRYEQLGIARPDYWSRLTLGYLTSKAIESANITVNQERRDLPSLLRELVSVWRLFYQCKGSTNDPLESISMEWQIPALESLPDLFESSNFLLRMQIFHPKIRAYPELGFCAVYLYSISDALKAIDGLHQEAAPFLQFLERLLAGSHVNSVFRRLLAPFQALPPDIQDRIVEELGRVPTRALAKLASSGFILKTTREATSQPGDVNNLSNTIRKVTPKIGVDEVAEMSQQVVKNESEGADSMNLEEFFLKRIARVVLSKPSSAKLETLWNEVVREYTTQGSSVNIPPSIYDAFLSGFLVLYDAPKSVEIWNHMIAHGIQPGSKTWTALLNGCAKARDLKGMNAMWQRMLSTGIEPNESAWTARVHGLISMRELDLGIAALDEMGKKWLSAEQTSESQEKRKGINRIKKQVNVNKFTKPTIDVVNAAIAALVQTDFHYLDKRRTQLVQKVLGWAKSFNIAPNVRTYNSLMQLHLRTGDYTTAFSLLRRMEASGLSGDIATYTMLIRFTFDNQQFDALSHAEQITRMISLLDSIEASGIKLNDYIYTMAIDRLLKQYSNIDAVRAITEHMLSRNMVIGAAIYTTVITHYFQSTPPNIAAVDSLVNQILGSPRVPNDRFLFDRILEGYANHGEVGKMMSVLTRMSTHGYRPGFQVLSAVVKALVEDEDYERASQVVKDVLEAQGNLMGGMREYRDFMALAKSHGLIPEKQESPEYELRSREVGL